LLASYLCSHLGGRVGRRSACSAARLLPACCGSGCCSARCALAARTRCAAHCRFAAAGTCADAAGYRQPAERRCYFHGACRSLLGVSLLYFLKFLHHYKHLHIALHLYLPFCVTCWLPAHAAACAAAVAARAGGRGERTPAARRAASAANGLERNAARRGTWRRGGGDLPRRHLLSRASRCGRRTASATRCSAAAYWTTPDVARDLAHTLCRCAVLSAFGGGPHLTAGRWALHWRVRWRRRCRATATRCAVASRA